MGLKKHEEPDYNLARFIVPYFMGFLLAVGGTLFMAGFKGQLKEAFGKERRFATITWTGALLLILIFGLATENAAITIILTIVQFVGLFWYVSTMVPGFKKFFCCCCRMATTASSGV